MRPFKLDPCHPSTPTPAITAASAPFRTRSRTEGTFVAAVAVFAGLVLAGCTQTEGTGEKGFISGDGIVTVLPVAEREPVPDLAGRTLDGQALALAEYGAGKTVVINVWGSWCGPCRAEADDLVEADAELPDNGENAVAFLGINVRDPSIAAAEAFVREFGIAYPSIVDEGEVLLAFSDTLPANAIPSTVVIDDQGRVAASIIGETTKATLVGVVDEVQAGGRPDAERSS
ncbi:TlpA family protein disulfide reductase [Nocardioides deserti]|uniref:TlpA family protein disulfide reductase n=1 Tax=Nocardioides deserti TaxID=1588644 RepID=A0ABR6U4L9_9ACTN|nr:TlpA disulfide reductase family protein [Nocardioides deserti]MBC2959386.1 TlpA family protein disulfide reductase [Nocardioides deserti]GGO73353.1 hypothetical protein GCM10012276_18730 [Nocardioides deserti]